MVKKRIKLFFNQKFEKLFYRLSDHIVTLTDVSVPIIKSLITGMGLKPPITVIRNFINLDKFKPKIYKEKIINLYLVIWVVLEVGIY